MMKRPLIVAFCLFITNVVCTGETAFVHLTVKDGLSNSTVYSATQDSKGFIWFCTETGVNRYDGRTFEKFTARDGLADNEIFKCYEDSKGRIWFLSYNGRLSYYLKGRFYNDVNTASLSYPTSGAFLLNCIEDKQGDIWFTTSLGEILQFHNNHIYLIPPVFIQGHHNAYHLSSVLFIENDSVKKLALDRTTKNIYTFNIRSKQLLHISNLHIENDNSAGAKLTEISFGPNKTFFFGQKTIFQYENGKIQKVNLPQINIKTRLMSYDYSNGHLFLGTAGEGIFKINTAGGDQQQIERIFPDETITDIFTDKEGNMWFTTYGNGVFLQKKSAEFITTLPTNNTYSVGVLHENNEPGYVFMGDDKGNIDVVVNNQVSKSIHLSNQKFNRVHDIFPLSADNIICICDEPHIYKYNVLNNSLKPIGADKDDMPTYKYACKMDNGVIWLCTQEGISKLSGDSLTFIASTYPYGRCFSIAALSDSVCYIGTSKGLYKRTGVNSISRIITEQTLEMDIIDIKFVNGSLWIATHGNGIFILQNDTVYKHINSENEGLVGDICQKLYDDGQEYVWLATNQGISIFDRTTKTLLYNLSSNNGLISGDVKNITRWGGQVYIATAEGANILKIKDILFRDIPPKVYVTSVKKGKDYIIDPGEQIVFNYADGITNINFTTITFQSPLDVQYEYKFDNSADWLRTQSTEISLFKLTPGAHQLLIRAKKYNSEWSPPVLLSIIVNPLWYQSAWLYIAIAAALAISVYYVFHNRIEAVRKRADEQNKFNQKITDLESKSLAYQMNPHFIFNSLNTLQQLILVNEQKLSLNYLQTFAVLMRRMLENSRKSYITINEEIEFLEQYLKLEKIRFNNKFEYNIEIDQQLLANEVKIPPVLLQPLLENAIKHGISLIDKQGMINLSVKQDAEFLIITVEDNGTGVYSGKSTNSSFLKKESTALKVIEERIKLAKNRTGVAGRMEIVDKGRLTDSASGTIIKLYIPLIP